MQRKLISIVAGALSLGLAGSGALVSAFRAPAVAAPSGTLVQALSQNPDTLTPAMGSLLVDDGPMGLMNASLIRLNQHDKWVGEVATSWKVSSNGLQYTFQLNPKAKWSDGRPLTAQDLIYSWHYYTNPKLHLTYTTGWNYVKNVTAPNPHTVVYTMTRPYAPFKSTIASADIVPAHVFSKWTVSQLNHGYYNTHAVVNGPYILQKWVPDQSLTFVPNPNWWGQPVHIKKIVFTVIPNQTTQFNNLVTGQLTMGSIPPQDLAQVSQLKPHFNIIRPLSAVYNQITPIEVGFLKNVAVRQALDYATPRQQIVKYILKNQAVTAFGDQVPGGYFYNPHLKPRPYSLTKAAALLKSQGFKKGAGGWLYKNGKQLDIPIWTGSTVATDVSIAQAVSQAWQKIGIHAPVHTAGWAFVFGGKGPQFNGKMEALLFGWGQGVFPDDTIDFNSKYIVTSPTSPGENVERYNNPLMNKLTVEGTTLASRKARRQVYWKIQQLEIQTVPIIFLYWQKSDFAYAKNLHGYQQTVFGTTPVWDWSLR